MMDFTRAELWLDQLQQFKIKLGISSTEKLLKELGQPQGSFPVIHIAGTNGKGSVGAILHALLTAAGFKSGFFSSPHLTTVRERFSINGVCMDKKVFSRLVSRIAQLVDGMSHPTYFECTTLLALLWFAEARVDIAILETGMGGRLDATNVVTPLVSIITSISLDHQQHLGSTIESIAAEKAGIIKPRIPVVCAGNDARATAVIAERCRRLESPLLLHGRDFFTRPSASGRFSYRAANQTWGADLPLPLAGAHQAVNAGLALAALEILAGQFPVPEPVLRAGLGRVRWPGRLELFSIETARGQVGLLLDGAHNQAGVRTLCQALKHDFPRRRLILIWGQMTDKDMGQAFFDLIEQAADILLTRAGNERSADPQDLLKTLPVNEHGRSRCFNDSAAALSAAMGLAGTEDMICVAGSLYLVGEVRSLLRGDAC